MSEQLLIYIQFYNSIGFLVCCYIAYKRRKKGIKEQFKPIPSILFFAFSVALIVLHVNGVLNLSPDKIGYDRYHEAFQLFLFVIMNLWFLDLIGVMSLGWMIKKSEVE